MLFAVAALPSSQIIIALLSFTVMCTWTNQSSVPISLRRLAIASITQKHHPKTLSLFSQVLGALSQ